MDGHIINCVVILTEQCYIAYTTFLQVWLGIYSLYDLLTGMARHNSLDRPMNNSR